MPRLTVVMPALNAADTIGLSLKSTLRAAPKDAEVVVWDDGSWDGTAALVDSISDRRVKLLQSSSSVGGGVARREVMKATDSEYVACMDADDYCFPWRFQRQLMALRRSDVCFGAVVKFGAGSPRPSLPLSMNAVESRAALLLHNPFSHPTMAARRAELERAGGYSAMRRAQDYEFWLRCAAQGSRVVRLALPLIGYRQSESQVSRATDYADGLLDPVLVASHGRLLQKVVPAARVRTVGRSDVVEPILGAFRGSLRRYYAGLVSRKGDCLFISGVPE